MSTRIVLQDNLWFRAEPHLANYFLDGSMMAAVTPRQGFTSSDDVRAKSRELRWLSRFTGKKGSGVVIAQQWHKPGNFIDHTLPEVWLPLLESEAPDARWCIFYDPILATRQRGLLAEAQPVDFDRPKVMRLWRRDLRYLRPYFEHPQYWRLADGHPVLYVWAAFALRNAEKAFFHARNEGLYVLADVLGTDVRPPHANGLTGFTVAYPGLERRLHRLPDVIPTFRRYYEATVASGYDFIPAGSCQYDDVLFLEARGLGEAPLQVLASDRSEIEEFLSTARAFAPPIDGTRYVFWGTLNNWAEGATVLPTKKIGEPFRTDRIGHYRFAHLAAIRNVLFP